MAQDIKEVADLQSLIEVFYTRAEADKLLGPFFSTIRDPKAHRELLCQYWSAVLFGTENYSGQPFPKHETLPLNHQHFVRWQTLFLETLAQRFGGPNADHLRVLVFRKSEEMQAKLELPGF